MPLRRRVLDVARRDGENLRLVAAALRLGRLCDLVVGDELRPALVRRHLGERRGQSGLPMVDVPDGADVHVRFAAIEFFFGHVVYVLLICRYVVLRSGARVTDSRGPPSLASRAMADNLRLQSRAEVGADDQDRTGDL